MNELKTMTGVPVSEVMQRMKAMLPPKAYKEITGNSAGLTDINPAYLTEVSTEVFGLCGYGWTYDYTPEDVEMTHIRKTSKQGREYDEFTVIIKRFYVSLQLTDGETSFWTRPFPVTGGSDNEAIENAFKGAITSALGHAFSRLCWQLDVYKGLLSHKNAAQEWDKRNGKPSGKPEEQKPAPAATTPPATLPDPKAKVNGNGTNGASKPAWPKAWKDKLVAAKYADNDFEAAGMLGKSHYITPASELTPELIVGWGKYYRADRDSGGTPEHAADIADAKLKAHLQPA